MTENDAPGRKRPGTTRRRFLGAAAALYLLEPTTQTTFAGDAPDPDSVIEDLVSVGELQEITARSPVGDADE